MLTEKIILKPATVALQLVLTREEHDALVKAAHGHTTPHPEGLMARLLIRDALIGMGLLALPRINRSKWAGRRR